MFPEILDFGVYKSLSNKHPGDANDWYWQLGYVPYTSIYPLFETAAQSTCANAFAGALEVGSLFYYLRRKFMLDTVVETGTFLGATTRFFSMYFEEVHTIELHQEHYNQAAANLKDCTNVRGYVGASPEVLRQLLPSLKGKRTLFYLDAHWYPPWPLLSEIEEIGKTHKDQAIIAIDDVEVSGRPDVSYDDGCSYDYFKKALDLAFSSYSKHWVIPSHPGRRAKFLAIPTGWVTHS